MTFEQALAEKVQDAVGQAAVITAYVCVVEAMDSNGDLQCLTLADSQSPPWRLHGLLEHGASLDGDEAPDYDD